MSARPLCGTALNLRSLRLGLGPPDRMRGWLAAASANSNRVARPPSEPFWPACARFDEIVAPAGQGRNWFFSAAVEQLERAFTYSSVFSGHSPNLAWLCAQPFAATEMERRRALQAIRTRRSADVPPRLCIEAPDHLNAAIWRESRSLRLSSLDSAAMSVHLGPRMTRD